MNAAIGFRVKSGWATAIVLAGASDSPQVIDRRTVELSDPAVPGSRQPYHVVMGSRPQDVAAVETRLCDAVRSTTRRSIDRFVSEIRQANKLRGAGFVVGSKADPSKIANDHIRAHALEGQLFRTALTDAAESLDLACILLVERRAYAEAASALDRKEDELKQAVTELGRGGDGPWRADEKLAALAAWVALVTKKESDEF
jgi:hypothetical protein